MRTAFLAVSLAVLTAACGGGDPGSPGEANPPSTTVETTTPATVPPPAETVAPDTSGGGEVSAEAANGPVILPGPAQSVVSLSPTATEMLFAVGAGDQVVAVDDQSDHPPEAPTTDLSGFAPNVEAIAAHDPDLVILSDDLDDIVASLDAIGIPVAHLTVAADIDDTYAQIEAVGALTGHDDEAASLVDGMRSEVERIVADLPADRPALTYYHELDPSYFSVTSDTFIGQVYGLLGLENIADAADTEGSGYPQLSAEYIIERDPDLVFLADAECCGVDPAAVAERPGWGSLDAIRSGHVYEVDEDIASRWGPRVVDFLRIAAGAVAEAGAAG
jgi:iron complex transport system substrate-binding protein